MKNCNRWIVSRMLEEMPDSKKATLHKMLLRNCYLTSAYVLSSCTLTVYKEGWYIKLEGTRCSFTVYAKDNDGSFEFIRKPVESKLTKLYSDWCCMNVSDFDFLAKWIEEQEATAECVDDLKGVML